MRSLIRPCLFAVARLGLLVAVVAWIVGQWRTVSLNASLAHQDLTCRCERRGYVVVLWDPPSMPFATDGFLTEPVAVEDGYSTLTFNEEVGEGFQYRASALGLVLGRMEDMATVLSLRHPLIVAVLLTSNIALHFIYRKRPESQPCED